MRIHISIYDSLKNPYYSGGGAHSTHEIAKFLSRNHKVTIICGAHGHSENRIIDGVFYKYIGPKWAGPKLGQFLFSMLLPIYALKENFDIWLENFQAPHSTGFIPLFTKKPVIGITTTLHAEDFAKKYKIPFHFIERMGIKTYQHLIVLNQSLERKIRFFNKKADIKIIPPAIEKEIFKIKNNNGVHVLFIGRLDIYQKGLDLLIKIWSEVVKDNKVKLIIAGSGTSQELKKIDELIRQNKLENYVTLVGRVDGKKKQELFSKTLIGLSPSRFESFGIVALEFMAAGKPFVCFDIEGFEWIPQSKALKIRSFNTNKFAQRIVEFLNDQKLRQEIGKKGKTFAQTFSFENISKQYESYVLEVGRNYGI